ncbi:uncharacterized protein DUF4236 [Microterricola gilva]|uniref:Uncharacterized protein DUF4236 n=1 Tax=Microterricola gilva TaxID=393267 RepID=A0A4Q8APF0_9MICO|nr:DUF4236 domain-containing protein [Microterricola gilva]RZU66458.1 uncharacterized protein DUF4236 [Microterricola gilva]
MGFYARKSIKAGPFRFNLSKSGLGVSAGVPGFRVGAGPRGNYVHLGAGGVYYRTTLGPGGAGSRRVSEAPADFRGSTLLLEDVTGASVQDLAPTGGGDVVEQLNLAASRASLGWPVLIAVFLIGAITMPFGLAVWALGVPLVWWLFLRDRARRTVVVFYDVNDRDAEWFEAMTASAGNLSTAQGIWRVLESGQISTTHQHKTNAGAGSLVGRTPAKVHFKGPKQLATNVVVPTIEAGKTSLHFLPDRVLVRENKKFTDIAYSELLSSASDRRFIESPGKVPSDARLVGETWQYVNVKGGPDRRYANNPRLPIMLYSEILLRSRSGFNWELQVSIVPQGNHFAQMLDYRRTM